MVKSLFATNRLHCIREMRVGPAPSFVSMGESFEQITQGCLLFLLVGGPVPSGRQMRLAGTC